MTIGTINLTPSETSAFNAVWSMVNALDEKLQVALAEKISETRVKTHLSKSITTAKSEHKAVSHHKYDITPEIRALEFGDNYSEGLSDDYKKEIGDVLAEKYL